MDDVARRIPWEDVRDPLSGLDESLADFVRQHVRRLGCLGVVCLLGGGAHQLTEPGLASETGRSVGEAKRDLSLLVASGLLRRVRGPRYVLTTDVATLRRLRDFCRRTSESREARLGVTAFALARELGSVEEELTTRRLVERAKGLLMQHHGLSEDEAQRFLLRSSRDRGQPLRQTAREILRELEGSSS